MPAADAEIDELDLERGQDADRPELLTTDEAAALLRVTPQTVRRLCVTGDLPAVRVGGVWRIPIAELDARLLRVARAPLPNRNRNNRRP